MLSAFLYLTACSRLRYQRMHAMAERFHSRNRNGFAEMTLDEAHIILTGLAELEFPTIFSTAVFFALFKVCGLLLLLSTSVSGLFNSSSLTDIRDTINIKATSGHWAAG